MGLVERVKGLEWQDWTVALLVVFVVVFGLNVFSDFKHLPSPIYGGDLYSHYGYAQNYLIHGFWNDPYYPGEFPTYPWFGHLLLILFKFVTGLSLMKAFLYFPIVSISGSLVAYYLLGIQFFKNKTFALMLGLLNMVWWGVVDGHPNLLPWMIEIPLFLFFWLRFEERGKRLDQMLMGVMLGLVALTHVAKFLGVLGAFGFVLLAELVRTRKFLVLLKKYLPVLVIGAVISLPFYAPILFSYGEPKNPVFEYNIQPIETFSPAWIARDVWNLFFYHKGLAFVIAGIAGLMGVVVCVFVRKKLQYRLLLAFFVGGMLAPLHHYVTRPLLDRWVLPYHLNATWIPVLIFITLGFREVFANLSRFVRKHKGVVQAALFLLLIVPMASARWDDFVSYRWAQYGRQLDPAIKAWLDFGEWAKKNTSPDDVFLAFDETGFAINAVSARKVMIVRRTHANYFVDIDKRIADAAVIFYGNNDSLRKELLKNYSVDYFLLDPMFLQGSLKTRPKFDDYLEKNGVRFERVHDRLDPSLPDAVRFDLLKIPPQNVSAGFDGLLRPVARFVVNGQNYLVVYRVVLENNLQE